VHTELRLDSRINDFRRNVLTGTLIDNIFKTHRAMLAYKCSNPELQSISVRMLNTDPLEEEKQPEDSSNDVNIKLE